MISWAQCQVLTLSSTFRISEPSKQNRQPVPKGRDKLAHVKASNLCLKDLLSSVRAGRLVIDSMDGDSHHIDRRRQLPWRLFELFLDLLKKRT
jgi:hypothetical protein